MCQMPTRQWVGDGEILHGQVDIFVSGKLFAMGTVSGYIHTGVLPNQVSGFTICCSSPPHFPTQARKSTVETILHTVATLARRSTGE